MTKVNLALHHRVFLVLLGVSTNFENIFAFLKFGTCVQVNPNGPYTPSSFNMCNEDEQMGGEIEEDNKSEDSKCSQNCGMSKKCGVLHRYFLIKILKLSLSIYLHVTTHSNAISRQFIL